MTTSENLPRVVVTTASETSPLLDAAASGVCDAADPEPTLGAAANANDDEPKIKVNMAQLLPALAIGVSQPVLLHSPGLSRREQVSRSETELNFNSHVGRYFSWLWIRPSLSLRMAR